ncbi:MAG: hypothetical protein V1702_02665 [Candidatus Woesearchaeota archaeon]
MTSEKRGVWEEHASSESPLSRNLQDQAAEILRKQLDKSISAQESIHSELKSQLALKEKDIETLKSIILRKNQEVAALSKSLQAKNETDEYYVKRLKEALLKKDAANQQIFSSLRQQLSAKDEEIRKKGFSSTESSRANEQLLKQLNEHLAQAYEQIDQLKTFVANETARSENLSNVFEKEIAEKEAIIAGLQKSKLNASGNSALAAQLEQSERKLKEKEATCRNLQMELAKLRYHHEDVSRQLQEKDNMQDYPDYGTQIGVLKMSLAEKDSEIKRLEAAAFEAHRSNERIARQLNAQLREAYEEIDQLKHFVTSESVKSSGLEEEFDKQLAEKDARIAELEQSLRESSRPKSSGRETAELKQLLSVKEESSAALQADLLKLKAQNTNLSRKLETSRKMIAQSEENFAKLAEEINSQHQQRIKDLITKNSVNEAALRSEMEQIKAEMKKKDSLIEAETLKVDDALTQFSVKYQQLLKLRNSEGMVSHVEEIEKSRIEKENMSELLKDAEAKLQRAIEREAAVDRREQMIMKEQDAINKQLDLLNAAGFEIGRTKDYLKKKLAEVELPAPESLASVMEEFSTEHVPEEIRMEIPAPEKLMPVQRLKPAEKPKLFQPKKEEFFNANTYSEIDELKSVIEIATQQGESLEKVRQSLIDSGYSKASIEKAFSSMQTVKR